MPALHSVMRKFLEDWREDVAPEWRDLLDGVEPAFGDIDPTLTTRVGEVIFPGRKGKAPPGAPPGSHVFRALDGLAPVDVRIVVIGQDPYPNVAQATGRAFDQGDLTAWLSAAPRTSPSLKRIAQQLARFRTGEPAYGARKGGWGRLKKDLLAERLALEAPGEVFDRWQSQGVLMLNAGLTLTRFKHPHQFRGHIPLWAPVVKAICFRLAHRPGRPLVFLCWGDAARSFLAQTDVIVSADQPIQIAPGMESTAVVDRRHPAVAAFLDGRDVFGEANDHLTAFGADPVAW